jgi:hypothetical protein
MLSLAATTGVLSANGIRCEIITPTSTYVTHARDGVVDAFLKSDATHLFWIDSDMGWTPRDFQQILALGTVLPVVGATYALRRDPPQVIVNGMGHEPNEYGCYPIHSMGLGFTCMQRKVMEELAATKPTLKMTLGEDELPDIFEFRTVKGAVQGEDITFFDDIGRLGYAIWLDPRITLNHYGMKAYSATLATKEPE